MGSLKVGQHLERGIAIIISGHGCNLFLMVLFPLWERFHGLQSPIAPGYKLINLNNFKKFSFRLVGGQWYGCKIRNFACKI